MVVYDSLNCTATTTAFVEDNFTLYISGGFSPNGDGINDTWTIIGLNNYPQAIIRVYETRYGTKVYENQGFYQYWNGTDQSGQLVNPTNSQFTYYYTIDLVSPAITKQGYLTIRY